MFSQRRAWWLHALFSSWILAGCEAAPSDCPECPPAALREAPATCEDAVLRCGDAGFAQRAEVCAFDDAPDECFVRHGEKRFACTSCDACDAAMRSLETEVCLTSVSACAAAPCHNGGACTETATGFTCSCRPGFTGATCDQDVDECASVSCPSASTCRNTYGSYVCACRAGYTGADCTQDVNECLGAPCLNGSSCTNLTGSFRCNCPDGVLGARCETDTRVCRGTPTACSARSTGACGDYGSGCSRTRPCVGYSYSCSSRYSSTTCHDIPGCYWSGYPYGTCTGTPTACEYRLSYLTDQCVLGCYRGSEVCAGTASACSNFPLESCSTQPGCSLVAP